PAACRFEREALQATVGGAMIAALLMWGCHHHEQTKPPPDTSTTASTGDTGCTTGSCGTVPTPVWPDLGPCSRPAAPVALSPTSGGTAPSCTPAAPGWVSGAATDLARARILGQPYDLFGLSVGSVAIAGGGTGLLVGAPHEGMPPVTGGCRNAPLG